MNNFKKALGRIQAVSLKQNHETVMKISCCIEAISAAALAGKLDELIDKLEPIVVEIIGEWGDGI